LSFLKTISIEPFVAPREVAVDKKRELDRAAEMIISFGKRWGSQYLDLASHAAFPLAVTPELLYLLRENFLPDCPWIAVADLLLSPLCLTVGDELYEMESAVRDVLLRRLAVDFRFGGTRLNELAEFMAVYVEAKLPEAPKIYRDLGTQFDWIALAYINPGDASRLREKLTQLLQQEEYRVHERIATFLEAQGDLLVAAGLEPLVASTHWHLKTGSPPHLFDVEVVTLVIEEAPKLKFETVLVNKRGEIVQTLQCEAYYYDEALGGSIEPLRMMAIPGGEFWMGSPETEKNRYNSESPQHKVTVKPFYMSQTPITQAQWRAIAALPQEAIELNPEPSGFQGDNYQ
jgi:hypothetical protein